MTDTHTPDARLAALRHWLESHAAAQGLQPDTLTPVSGDASFRRYFRIQAPGGARIVMDAPPPQENCGPFVDIAQRLAAAGLRVPAILAQDLDQGFLLLTDLGPQTFYEAIQAGQTRDDTAWQQHMRGALRALTQLQQCPTDGLPVYDQARLRQELDLFPQWYLRTHLGHAPGADAQAALDRLFDLLAGQAAAQPRVFVHRDYHSPNLMMGPGAPDFPPGVIDFQDALLGPISYDIASLVMDARTTWDEPQQLDWAIRYWEYARAAQLPVPADFAQFHQQYEWMGLQRNLRILGVFARLSHRDGKHHYLDHMPRVQAYVRQVAGRYTVFHPLLRLLDQAEQVPLQNGYSF
ncbi:aminoglycoside phosphotransferase family protein [Castellaniella sp.]|uniref:aminoglycoside phosphotransferase family protein n=1 Tax=Castellaniella sp. TaxID=1955812 RepID=UPI003C762973